MSRCSKGRGNSQFPHSFPQKNSKNKNYNLAFYELLCYNGKGKNVYKNKWRMIASMAEAYPAVVRYF